MSELICPECETKHTNKMAAKQCCLYDFCDQEYGKKAKWIDENARVRELDDE